MNLNEIFISTQGTHAIFSLCLGAARLKLKPILIIAASRRESNACEEILILRCEPYKSKLHLQINSVCYNSVFIQGAVRVKDYTRYTENAAFYSWWSHKMRVELWHLTKLTLSNVTPVYQSLRRIGLHGKSTLLRARPTFCQILSLNMVVLFADIILPVILLHEQLMNNQLID